MRRPGWAPLAVGLVTAGLAIATGLTWAKGSEEPRAEAAVPLGRALFSSKGCATCHAGPDEDRSYGVAPSLRDLAEVAGSQVAGKSAADYVRQSITDPAAVIAPGWQPQGPVSVMPRLAVSPAEVEAIVSYLLTPPPQGS